MFLALEAMNGIYQILIYGFYLLSPTSKRELMLSCNNSRHKSEPETLLLPFRKEKGDNIGLSF
jgi:hypothetical protein